MTFRVSKLSCLDKMTHEVRHDRPLGCVNSEVLLVIRHQIIPGPIVHDGKGDKPAWRGNFLDDNEKEEPPRRWESGGTKTYVILR